MDSNNLHPTEECSDCKVHVCRVFKLFHKSPAKGDTTKRRRKYTDETGRLWHGTKCPDCAAKWRKDKAESQAAKKQEELKKLIES